MDTFYTVGGVHMTGCCDMCESPDHLYSFAVPGRHTLYLCHKCLYELRTERDRYHDNEFDTNDGTLAPAGGVRDPRAACPKQDTATGTVVPDPLLAAQANPPRKGELSR